MHLCNVVVVLLLLPLLLLYLGCNIYFVLLFWSAGHVISADFSQAEESAVEAIASQSPCIVALGQSISLCVEIINWILGCEVLPKPAASPWRTVHLRYGQHNRACLLEHGEACRPTLPDTTPASSSSSGRRVRSWTTTVPLVEVELSDGELDRRPLDIRANLPMLASGARVTIIDCCSSSVIESFNNCISDVVPIVIYAFRGDVLNVEVFRNHFIEIKSLFVLYINFCAYNIFWSMSSL